MRLLLFAVASTLCAKDLTFDDVRAIFAARCVGCHQPGEIGPMPLTSYAEIRPWAKAIRDAISRKTMPPWHAAPSAHAFANDRSLLPAEIETVKAWVNAGALAGGSADVPRPAKPADGWRLGKPDWVARIPGFRVPASGDVKYTFLIAPTNFPKDVWIQAAEFRIDKRAVIHHMNAFARGPGSSYVAGYPAGKFFEPTKSERVKPREGERSFDRRQLLLGYEPGYVPTAWPQGEAKLIAAGSDIVFEIHYTTNGKETVDETEFGLYFAKQPPERRLLAIQAANEKFAIPPGDGNYRSEAMITFAQPVELLSLQPHMHLRGKAMEIRAAYPDGSAETLLNVPKYDFNWQTTYFLAKPVRLPAGTRVECIAWFDNSPNNRANPDPQATVRWGDQSWEEMHIGFLEVLMDAKADAEKLLDPARSQRVDVHPN